MKGIKAEYPYNDYYLYVVFHKKEGRNYANLIPINKECGLKRKTISYARYLMSVKEKRILNKEEEVDHIDDVKTNDRIENLQILSSVENLHKEAKRRGRKFVTIKCPYCKKIFDRPQNKTHLGKNGKYTGCSRKCSTIFSTMIQYTPNDENVINALRENVIKEYIKHI